MPLTRAPNELRLSRSRMQTRGMNFRYEWTVNRETKSFYGVTNAASRDKRQTRRSCYSLNRLSAGWGRPSDRGMVHPPIRLMQPQAKHTRNRTTALVLSLLAHTRYPPGIAYFEVSQINCDYLKRFKKARNSGRGAYALLTSEAT